MNTPPPELLPPTESGTVPYFPSEPSRTLPPLSTLPDTNLPPVLPQVPGYEVQKELGRGGMGVVYLARQTALNRLVALKMVATEFVQPEARRRFLAEAEAIAQLQHPGIVQIHEVGYHGGQPYLALEYVPGGSLVDRLRGEPQPPRAAAELVAQVALAVQAAHDKGIIHRDLKPANILLAVSDQLSAVSQTNASEKLIAESCSLTAIPKLTDFGLAKRQDSMVTATGVAVGTPCYMAPEQVLGLRTLTPATDVYALGAILYEMLTGRPPFKAATPVDTMMQVTQDEVVPPRKLQSATPSDLETICLKCLEKEPTKRYASATALAEDLQRYLRGEPILARPANTVERFVKWARRKPTLAGLLGMVMVALLILSAAVVLLWQANNRETLLREVAEANARRAWEKEEEARTAQKKAEELFRTSRSIVVEVLAAVTETPLLQQPSLREVRKLLLEKAVPLFERLLVAWSADQGTLEETARYYDRLGQLTHEIGNTEKAKEAYRQALRHREQLAAAEPGRPARQADVATAWNSLGVQHYKAGERQETSRCWREALRIRQQLAAAHPSETVYRVGVADSWSNLGVLFLEMENPAEAQRCWKEALRMRQDVAKELSGNVSIQGDIAAVLNNLGVLERDLGRHEEAERSFWQALDIHAKLAAQPDKTLFSESWADAWNNLGILLCATGRRPEAEDAYREALRLREQLAKANPGVLPYWVKWGASCNNLGLFCIEDGEFAEAVTWYDQGLQVLVPVRQKDPRNVAARLRLHDAHCGRADALSLLGKHTEALAECEKAIALKHSPPPDLNVSLLRGRIQARAKDVVAAEKTVRELKQSKLDGRMLVTLARTLSICLEAVPGDEGKVEQFTAEALRFLKQAAAGGWFKDEKHLLEVEQTPDFSALRKRREYQAWRQSFERGR
jgi:eukaryotic-like serine/threonine-protein kinase